MSDPFCQEALETPHSLDTAIEYSQSASSPCPIKEPGFLGNLDVPSLARGHKYEHEHIVLSNSSTGQRNDTRHAPRFLFGTSDPRCQAEVSPSPFWSSKSGLIIFSPTFWGDGCCILV